jgi:hypothetical protein
VPTARRTPNIRTLASNIRTATTSGRCFPDGELRRSHHSRKWAPIRRRRLVRVDTLYSDTCSPPLRRRPATPRSTAGPASTPRAIVAPPPGTRRDNSWRSMRSIPVPSDHIDGDCHARPLRIHVCHHLRHRHASMLKRSLAVWSIRWAYP